MRSLFDQSWRATGRLPKDMGRLYRRLFDSRQKGDDDDLVRLSHPTLAPEARAAVAPVLTTQ